MSRYNRDPIYPGSVKRYVITHFDDSKQYRRLTFGAHGTNTYSTPKEAAQMLKLYRGPQGLPRVLSSREVASLRVKAWLCWPNGGDPCGTVSKDDR